MKTFGPILILVNRQQLRGHVWMTRALLVCIFQIGNLDIVGHFRLHYTWTGKNDLTHPMCPINHIHGNDQNPCSHGKSVVVEPQNQSQEDDTTKFDYVHKQ